MEMHNLANAKFNRQAAIKMVGGFFVLRIFSPCLMMPDTHGVVEGVILGYFSQIV
jgi:hypothetical protein